MAELLYFNLCYFAVCARLMKFSIVSMMSRTEPFFGCSVGYTQENAFKMHLSLSTACVQADAASNSTYCSSKETDYRF